MDAAADHRRTILVIEDEALVRMVTADALQELGFEVEEAASAAEGLERFQARRAAIAVAIIDVGLPDRSGDLLAADLRALAPDLPLVIASGYGQVALGELDGDPHVHFLAKPYSSSQLEGLLRDLGLG